jgi:hypothetical protein
MPLLFRYGVDGKNQRLCYNWVGGDETHKKRTMQNIVRFYLL